MNRFALQFSAVLFLLILMSCSRERIEPTKELNAYEPMYVYMDSKKAEEQVFEVTEELSEPIQGIEGTKIWMSKEILMFADGSDVEWPYTVKLVELYTPKQMIYYQMPTIAGGNILQTRGEVRVRAFKEDAQGEMQELVLKPEAVYALEMPSDTMIADMKVYYGYQPNGKPDWTDDVNEVNGNAAQLYFTEMTNSYKANIGKLGWINCAYPKQSFYNISFKSEEDDLTNVEIFSYIPETNTVGQAYNKISNDFPKNTYTKVIAMGINAEGQLFYQFVDLEIAESVNMPITLEPITEAELDTLLNSL